MEENKVRLIDAEAFKRYIDCGHLRPPTEICFSEIDAISMIDRQPTVDAVPVVRCKDCKYRFTLDCPMRHEELTYDEDDGYDWIDHDYTSDDRFCNEGARMDGEADG